MTWRKSERYSESCSTTAGITSSFSSTVNNSDSEMVQSDISDPDMKEQQMRVPLPHLAMQADRYSIGPSCCCYCCCNFS